MQNPVGATTGYSCDGVHQTLQIAHDADFGRFSPGTPLESVEMCWFFEKSDLGRYRLLSGSVFDKRRWTNAAISTSRVAMMFRDKAAY